MRTVTIPSNMNPWVCNINGVVYSYEAGAEQSVPDEVASLIDNINADQPVSGHPGNDGDVLTMTESGEPVWLPTGGGGGGGAMVVHFAIDEDLNVTADKTVTEVKEMLNSGAVASVIEYFGDTIYGNVSTYVMQTGMVIGAGVFSVGDTPGGNEPQPFVVESDNEWVATDYA